MIADGRKNTGSAVTGYTVLGCIQARSAGLFSGVWYTLRTVVCAVTQQAGLLLTQTCKCSAEIPCSDPGIHQIFSGTYSLPLNANFRICSVCHGDINEPSKCRTNGRMCITMASGESLLASGRCWIYNCHEHLTVLLLSEGPGLHSCLCSNNQTG